MKKIQRGNAMIIDYKNHVKMNITITEVNGSKISFLDSRGIHQTVCQNVMDKIDMAIKMKM